ncbi:MAG: hypothetical protein JW741_16810 [Sedimentisphaerales bacterium]|nr:hypothetical protein [Sedimentisphaerales bacterium]
MLPETGPRRLEWMCRNLRVPAVCDILDDLGYRRQAMHQRLRLLDPQHCTFAGRAKTFRWMETDYVVKDDPYGLEIDAMDSLAPGDVAVHSTDHGQTNAPWGELMSTLARRNGAVGCVLVQPGELVFADFDGVVVIPQAVEEKALLLAADKLSKENDARRELLNGRTLRDVFDEFGVL